MDRGARDSSRQSSRCRQCVANSQPLAFLDFSSLCLRDVASWASTSSRPSAGSAVRAGLMPLLVGSGPRETATADSQSLSATFPPLPPSRGLGSRRRASGAAAGHLTFNFRSILAQTPCNTIHQPVAKPLKNQQDSKPALTYEPGGRKFESCRAHQINNLQPRVVAAQAFAFNSVPRMFFAGVARPTAGRNRPESAGCCREHLVEKQPSRRHPSAPDRQIGVWTKPLARRTLRVRRARPAG
jgi:hypothetical protein